jgi:hypothetical protein
MLAGKHLAHLLYVCPDNNVDVCSNGEALHEDPDLCQNIRQMPTVL